MFKSPDEEELRRAELLLSNCAYWAMNALGLDGSLRHVNEIREICLRNILRASEEFTVVNKNADSTVSYDGRMATLTPEKGWPEPKIEWMQ